jgi:hypothetical protein
MKFLMLVAQLIFFSSCLLDGQLDTTGDGRSSSREDRENEYIACYEYYDNASYCWEYWDNPSTFDDWEEFCEDTAKGRFVRGRCGASSLVGKCVKDTNSKDVIYYYDDYYRLYGETHCESNWGGDRSWSDDI